MGSYYEIVEGLRLPRFVGGRPALDFCNTFAGWDGLAAVEYLRDYDHLALWTAQAGLLPRADAGALRAEADRSTRRAAAIVGRARRFRGALYEALVSPDEPPAWEALNDEIRRAAPFLRLHAEGAFARWRVDAAAAGLAAPLAAVVWSAAGFLASEDRAHVHACPGTGCGWLFLDAQGRRRWCLMEVCGNRAKARRFAARRAGDETPARPQRATTRR